MDAIRVQALTKRYGDTLAVDGIDFTAAPGVTVGLLGGNGAGKTTTLAMLLGLLLPTSGAIHVLGHDIARNRFPALARMNFASPYIALPSKLTVAENLRVYCHLYDVGAAEQRIAELTEELDLGGFLHRRAGDLSAGQKTRVALAKALINRPAVLLLDEPTASLDPDTGDLVRGWLERYRAASGCTILLASHNMAEVERLCDEVLVMKRGRIVDRGSPAALLERYGRDDLEEVFLDIARNRTPIAGAATAAAVAGASAAVAVAGSAATTTGAGAAGAPVGAGAAAVSAGAGAAAVSAGAGAAAVSAGAGAPTTAAVAGAAATGANAVGAGAMTTAAIAGAPTAAAPA